VLVLASSGFGVTMLFATLAPTLAIELVALALVGSAQIAFMSAGNSTLQLGAAPEMRGRVMALWFVAFQGSTPIGGPIVGGLMALAGARAGLALGAATCVVAAAAGALTLRRREHTRAARLAGVQAAASVAMLSRGTDISSRIASR
jgi:MFS family permease